MAWAGRWAGVVATGFVAGVLALAGCQGQRADAPGTQSEPAATGLRQGERSRSPEEIVRGRTTYEETPRGVTTNGNVAAAKKVPGEAGQPEPAGPAVELALRFVPGQAATYRLTTEYYKSIEWKGSTASKPAQFTDGRTGNHVEFTFEQRVQQVQDDGAAGLEITIKGLKYVTEAVNKTVFDFDSARPQDANRPLAALIGKSYRVKMSPQGQVVEIADIEPVRQAEVGGLPDRSIADRLLADDEIRSRHEIAALSGLERSRGPAGTDLERPQDLLLRQSGDEDLRAGVHT